VILVVADLTQRLARLHRRCTGGHVVEPVQQRASLLRILAAHDLLGHGRQRRGQISFVKLVM
jgi:hypothetical protein